LALLALGCFCSVGIPAIHAEDSDGNLVPGDSEDFVILANLLTGQVPTVTVGDKVFSMFSYSNAGDMPAAADVQVFGFQDLDGNYGLSLHGVFWDLFGDETGSSATFAFDVAVNDQGQQLGNLISDAHLILEGPGVGADSEIKVDESFAGASETLQVFSTSLGGPTVNQLSDFVDFSQNYSFLQVSALISAKADVSATQPARASAIDLTFSQTVVPEPSSALLMLFAGAATAIGRGRRGLLVG
jgi:hypothetical protein